MMKDRGAKYILELDEARRRTARDRDRHRRVVCRVLVGRAENGGKQ
jgi:hypothetical protein